MSLFTSDREFLGGEEALLMSGLRWSGSPLSTRQRSSGRLSLSDGSHMEGDFEPRGGFEGEFRHFSGVTMTGKFSHGRFIQGTIRFPDGDRLEASFRMRGGLWVASSAILFGAEGAEGVPVQGPTQAGSKKFLPALKEVGFAIEWAQGIEGSGQKLSRLLLAPSGYYEYAKTEGAILSSHKLLPKLIFPCEQIERFTPQKRNILVIHPLGFAILPCPNDRCLATFKGMESLIFKGTFTHTESKFSMKGAVFEAGKEGSPELAKLRVKKRIEGELSIEFDSVQQTSLLAFQKNLGLLAKKFAKKIPEVAEKKTAPAARWTALKSLAIAVASEGDKK